MLFNTCAASSGVLGESSIIRFAHAGAPTRPGRIESGTEGENIFDDFDPAHRKRFGLFDAEQAESYQAVNDDRLISIGEFEKLENHAGCADGIKIGHAGVFDLRIFLRDDADHFFPRHDFIEKIFAFLPAHVQRHHRAGEDDDIANGQNWDQRGDEVSC